MALKTLKKPNHTSVSVQVKNTLLKRIRTGYYRPGERMDAIRKIADEFKVSSLTVQKACKLLEQEGAIIPVPQSGLYVSESFLEKPARQMRIVFVFPEVEISPRVLHLENWGLNSELTRGFQAGVQENGAKLDFLYIDQTVSSREMYAHARKIREKYDFAIFASHQLPELQQILASEGFPFFTLCDNPDQVIRGAIPFYYDHGKALEYLLDLVKSNKPEKILIVSNSETEDALTLSRADRFAELCMDAGYSRKQITHHVMSQDDSESLLPVLAAHRNSFIFSNNAYLVRNIYIAAMKNGLIPGRDLMIAAIATGVTFTGLIPSLTYVRVPVFELGLQVIRTACKMFKDEVTELKKWDPVLPELIINESVKITKNKIKGVAS